jgi:hypothetical protein
LEGFWPCNNWKLNSAKVELPSTTLIVDLEDPLIFPYYGPKNLKLAPTYTPFRFLNNGDFVLVTFHNPFLVPIWLGKTQSDVTLSLFGWEEHKVMLPCPYLVGKNTK